MAEELLRQLVQALREGRGNEAGPRRVLDTRGVHLPTFDGEAAQFGDWSFSFKRGIRAMSPQTYDLMVEAEKPTAQLDGQESQVQDTAIKASGEIYDLLCQYCGGEALAVIRAVDDCKGFYAWKKLCEKYRPRTLARQVQLLQAVLNPIKITDARDMEAKYVLWLQRMREEQTQYGSLALTDRAKLAILTSMVPKWAQEYIYMHVEESWTVEVVWEKIRAISANRVDQGGPVPMDVGEIHADGEGSWTADVDAINKNTKCYKCGGFGHIAAQCKNQGKGGEKGKGKGGRGYGGEGGPGNGKAKGKGYQGTCWECGKVGHKAAECQQRRMAGAVEGQEGCGDGQDDDNEMKILTGGVWRICAVQETSVLNKPKDAAQDAIYRQISKEAQAVVMSTSLDGESQATVRDRRQTWTKGPPKMVSEVAGRGTFIPRVAVGEFCCTGTEVLNPFSANACCTVGFKRRVGGIRNPVSVTNRFEALSPSTPSTVGHCSGSEELGLGCLDEDHKRTEEHAKLQALVHKRKFEKRGPTPGIIKENVKRGPTPGNTFTFHPIPFPYPLRNGSPEGLGAAVGKEKKLEREKESMEPECEKVVIAGVQKQGSKAKIMVDSGAGLSVWPMTWRCPGTIQPTSRSLRLEAANGSPIKIYGERKVQFQVDGRGSCEMAFVVTDVTKPLAAVSAITKAGNKVVFKPGKEGSYIENTKSGERIELTCENGVYTMEVDILGLDADADFAGQA